MKTSNSALGPLFPILNSDIFRAIPWRVIENCETQAQQNHSQTLARLAERGGLSPCEAVAVLDGKYYHERWPNRPNGKEADALLLAAVSKLCRLLENNCSVTVESLRECVDHHEKTARVCLGSADSTAYNLQHHLIKDESIPWHKQDMAFQTEQAGKHQRFANIIGAAIRRLEAMDA